MAWAAPPPARSPAISPCRPSSTRSARPSSSPPSPATGKPPAASAHTPAAARWPRTIPTPALASTRPSTPPTSPSSATRASLRVCTAWAPHSSASTSRPGTRAALWLAHVGDSRCYRLRSGVLTLLTRDHSLVEEQVQAGLLSRVQAAASPIRNIITRAVGCQPEVEPDIAAHAAQPGDLYLLASDGLTRELDDAEIALVLARTLGPALTDPPSRRATAAHRTLQHALDSACHALIDAANQHGGGDNITVLLVYCL